VPVWARILSREVFNTEDTEGAEIRRRGLRAF
jgi:hypothetical protein